MMEPNQKKKFVCKFCNKRYPCGKSLGGHIRIHQNSNYSTDDDQAAANKLTTTTTTKDSSIEAAAGSYILRENPKKTTRFEAAANAKINPGLSLHHQDKICKECGKGFHSLKALCGHMACHSRNYNYDDDDDDQSDTSDKLKDLVMDDHSDTETSSPSKRRRSKRTTMRYKNISLCNSSSNNTAAAAAPASFSSMASDLEQEQEEVAWCLIMLSKDSSLKGCLSYVGDSSDNNSVVLETKSSCLTKMRIRARNNINNNGSSCFDEDDDDDNSNSFLEMKIARKKKQQQQQQQHQKRQVVVSSENDDDGYDSANSDSGYFNYGPKKVVESEIVSCHGSSARVEMGSRFDEKGKITSGLRRVIEKDGILYDSSRKRGSTKIVASIRSNIHHKRGRDDDNVYESGENSLETDNTTPRSKKVIKSSNTGGKNNPQGKSSKVLSSSAAAAAAAKKAKTHECPFCSKVFKSGQALGGHKRSHFVGAADDATVVIKQQVGLIDLNLPAPVEEEQQHHRPNNGFVTW